ncbi:mechanosensitive ion channel [Arenibacter sp. GZD96]|uniref:mechanosensitive ion channel domain-containing protein n=1 Tax=Aurantibrevibacter litoralis TaxID=3106030 RepID=UPI002AFE1456|nr:mechanosensitive ion channel domain-containing protein [Arenibacter sp. GZD-96]MEA1786202.1 mechanosensitive ion channel [Arenibacter sp. GZD-96]
MEDFLTEYQKELVSSGITIVVLLIVKFIFAKTIRRVGALTDINRVRTRLIVKYVSGGLTSLGIVALILIWGVNIKDLGLIFSSVFAVIGVALFAQWSILSNVTAGVILFFSFPFRIGDRVKIFDKDMLSKDSDSQEIFLIEDIKAFHIHLRSSNGELLTYPNNLMLQKAVALVYSYENS